MSTYPAGYTQPTSNEDISPAAYIWGNIGRIVGRGKEEELQQKITTYFASSQLVHRINGKYRAELDFRELRSRCREIIAHVEFKITSR